MEEQLDWAELLEEAGQEILDRAQSEDESNGMQRMYDCSQQNR